MYRPVTAWIRWEPSTKGPAGRWTFNHIEDGHASTETPADSLGRGWARGQWRSAHGELVPDGTSGAQRLVYARGALFDVE